MRAGTSIRFSVTSELFLCALRGKDFGLFWLLHDQAGATARTSSKVCVSSIKRRGQECVRSRSASESLGPRIVPIQGADNDRTPQYRRTAATRSRHQDDAAQL